MTTRIAAVLCGAMLLSGCATGAALKRSEAEIRAARVRMAADVRGERTGRLVEGVALDAQTVGLAIEPIGFWEKWQNIPGWEKVKALFTDGTIGALIAYLGKLGYDQVNDDGTHDRATVIRDNSGPVTVPANSSAVIERNSGPVEVNP